MSERKGENNVDDMLWLSIKNNFQLNIKKQLKNDYLLHPFCAPLKSNVSFHKLCQVKSAVCVGNFEEIYHSMLSYPRLPLRKEIDKYQINL